MASPGTCCGQVRGGGHGPLAPPLKSAYVTVYRSRRSLKLVFFALQTSKSELPIMRSVPTATLLPSIDSLFKEADDMFLIVLLTIATMHCSLCYERNVIYSSGL